MSNTIDPNSEVVVIGESDFIPPVQLDSLPVEMYGIASIAIATTFPLIWKLVLEDHATFGTTGLKLATYFNLLGYGPYAVGYLAYLVYGQDAATLLGLGMNWSLVGTWFLNFYAIYVTFYNSLTSFSLTKLITAAIYSGYSAATMAMQVVLIPGVNSYIRGYNFNESRLDYESPEQDRKQITDFDAIKDNAFITGEDEATAGFPDEEEDSELQR